QPWLYGRSNNKMQHFWYRDAGCYDHYAHLGRTKACRAEDIASKAFDCSKQD
ncbi:hypothetical protein L195_g062905, partial [Trifolium pratense]